MTMAKSSPKGAAKSAAKSTATGKGPVRANNKKGSGGMPMKGSSKC